MRFFARIEARQPTPAPVARLARTEAEAA
jgi:hypothetical protein